MWIFMGFRGHIMSDFISYYPYYNEYPDIFHLTSDAFINGFEPGFNIYTAIIKSITKNYFAWVAINTMIDLTVFFWFFKKYCKSAILPLIFFMAFNGLLMEFNLYRNMKALDLFLLSLPYLQKRKWSPYFALNLLGLTFHTSSIIYLPLYFILNYRMPRYIMWSGFIIANIVFIFNIGFIGSIINNLSVIQDLDAYDKITRYADTGTQFKFSIGYFERTLSFCIFSLFYAKLTEENKANIIFYNCYWIYYITFLFFYEVSVFVDRIPTLFMFSYWVLYPAVTKLKIKLKQPILLLISLIVILKIMTSFGMASKYENIIFTTPDYDKRARVYEKSIEK